MNESVPDCLVRGHETLIDALVLPDADDRHVLAAAIVCGAQMIVTFNLKDFPASALEPYNIEAQHPDDFLVNQIYLEPGAVMGTINQQASALREPPHTANDVIDAVERAGLIQSATMLRRCCRDSECWAPTQEPKHLAKRQDQQEARSRIPAGWRLRVLNDLVCIACEYWVQAMSNTKEPLFEAEKMASRIEIERERIRRSLYELTSRVDAEHLFVAIFAKTSLAPLGVAREATHGHLVAQLELAAFRLSLLGMG